MSRNVDYDKEVVSIEVDNEWIVYLNFKQEELGRVKKDFAKSLEDWHQRLYKVKCESSADMIRSLAKGLMETANNIEKEV